LSWLELAQGTKAKPALVFDAMTTWRTEIVGSSEEVIEKMAALTN
jgi:hypothetical protein